MPFNKTLLGFCLISYLSLVSARILDSDKPTAYEMLERFNFPKGILPQGAKGYILKENGNFEVFLNGDCKFEVEGGYSLHYKSKITGKVSMGSLKELQGVSVKVLFLWLSITDVSTADGQLYFYVGPAFASFPISNFEEIPQCGCGLDCLSFVADS